MVNTAKSMSTRIYEESEGMGMRAKAVAQLSHIHSYRPIYHNQQQFLMNKMSFTTANDLLINKAIKIQVSDRRTYIDTRRFTYKQLTIFLHCYRWQIAVAVIQTAMEDAYRLSAVHWICLLWWCMWPFICFSIPTDLRWSARLLRLN